MYSLLISKKAQKELSSIEKNYYEKIKDALRSLSSDPRPGGCKKLTGRSGWRIRVADFRVLYEINDSKREIYILHIGHRKDVYRS